MIPSMKIILDEEFQESSIEGHQKYTDTRLLLDTFDICDIIRFYHRNKKNDDLVEIL